MTQQIVGQLQVVSDRGQYKLVMRWKGMDQDVLAERPSGVMFQVWEESKYTNLSLAAAWFANLPDVGRFVFEDKEYVFGPESGTRFRDIRDFGSRVSRAYDWLQETLRERGWEV